VQRSALANGRKLRPCAVFKPVEDLQPLGFSNAAYGKIAEPAYIAARDDALKRAFGLSRAGQVG
jgi:hypothetical protein